MVYFTEENLPIIQVMYGDDKAQSLWVKVYVGATRDFLLQYAILIQLTLCVLTSEGGLSTHL